MPSPRCAFYTTERHAPWVGALGARLAEGGVEVTVHALDPWSGVSARAGGGRRLLPAVEELVGAASARPFAPERFAAALVAAAELGAGGVDPRAALAGATVARRVGAEAVPWLGRLLAPLARPAPEADLAHATAAGWEAGPAIVAAARDGAALVVSDAGVFVREQVRALDRAGVGGDARAVVVDLVLALARTAYALADAVTADCHYVQRWQQELGADHRRCEIVAGGVDPARFAPAPRPAGGVVVQVAPVEPAAGTMAFVEMAARVRERRPEARFVHRGPVADPDYAAEVEERRQALGLGDALVFAGPADEPEAAYADADVVCLTPVEDGYPQAAVEALMCGRPVVSTDAGGAREVLGRVGLLAPPGGVDALAEAVVRVLALSPAARATMGHEARERAVAHFSLEATVTAYRRLYDRLLRAPRRAVPAAPADPVDEARRLARMVVDDPDPAARRAAVRDLERLLAEAG